jgi:pilus assembly protein CpaB
MNKVFHHSGFRRRSERERLFFFLAAGLAFSLLIISLVVLNFRTEAVAKSDLVPTPQNPIPKSLGTVTLFAPERQITQGTNLSEVKFKEVYWPHDQVPEGAVRDLAEVKNTYAVETLRALVPVQRAMLSTEPIQASLPVTPGNRAIAIQLDAFSGVEGHIRTGSRVDVTLTYYEQGDLTTKIIVQNARVLSYGGMVKNQQTQSEAPRRVMSSATLDVSAEDALTILTSKKLGTLNLILRATDDTGASKVVEFDENKLNRDKAKKTDRSSNCGVAKVGGIEYVMPCGAGDPMTKLDPSESQ